MVGMPSTSPGTSRGTSSLMPESLDGQLLARQIQILADVACDAMRLAWYAREFRKVNGVLKAMDELMKKKDSQFLMCN